MLRPEDATFLASRPRAGSLELREIRKRLCLRRVVLVDPLDYDVPESRLLLSGTTAVLILHGGTMLGLRARLEEFPPYGSAFPGWMAKPVSYRNQSPGIIFRALLVQVFI